MVSPPPPFRSLFLHRHILPYSRPRLGKSPSPAPTLHPSGQPSELQLPSHGCRKSPAVDAGSWRDAVNTDQRLYEDVLCSPITVRSFLLFFFFFFFSPSPRMPLHKSSSEDGSGGMLTHFYGFLEELPYSSPHFRNCH